MKETEERFEQAKAFIKNKETNKAAPLISQLVSEGHSGAMYYMNECWGFLTAEGYTSQKGIELMRQSALLGYAPAQHQLGRWAANGDYPESGEWGKKDLVKAAEWYRKAAEQGYDEAQLFLGLSYDRGEGVDQDHAQAVEWFRKAAEQGNEAAQNNLGRCYEEGNGVGQDYGKAAEWYGKAAAQDDFFAQSNLDSLKVRRLIPGQTGIDDRLERAKILCDKKGEYDEAVILLHELAGEGNAEALFMLGNRFYYGQGVDKDYAKTAQLYCESAERGFAEAQYQLGSFYDKGFNIIKPDTAKTLEWWNKAAAQGHVEAQFELGLCCYYGRGTAQDRAKAVEWWGKAAGLGHKRAKIRYDITLTETEDVLETITAEKHGKLLYIKSEGAYVEKGESPFSIMVQMSSDYKRPLLEMEGTPAQYAGTLHYLVEEDAYVWNGDAVAQILKG